MSFPLSPPVPPVFDGLILHIKVTPERLHSLMVVHFLLGRRKPETQEEVVAAFDQLMRDAMQEKARRVLEMKQPRQKDKADSDASALIVKIRKGLLPVSKLQNSLKGGNG